jgi:TolB protein
MRPPAVRASAGRSGRRLPLLLMPVAPLGCLLAGLALILGFAEAASAAFPGRNGKIAFVHRPGGHTRGIYTMRPNGTHEHRIVRRGEDPSFSANGKKIVFARRGDIYTMRASGSHKRRVTDGWWRKDYSPSFSPSGRKIVFSRVRRGATNVYTIRTDGSHLRRLTRRGGATPAFSPDGRSIAFADRCGGLSIMNSDGSGKTRLTDRECMPGPRDISPDFSPDGQWVVFERLYSAAEPFQGTHEIYVIRRDGSELTQPDAADDYHRAPAFSPDGRSIAFTRGPQSGWPMRIYKITFVDGYGAGYSYTRVGNLRWSYNPNWGVRR